MQRVEKLAHAQHHSTTPSWTSLGERHCTERWVPIPWSIRIITIHMLKPSKTLTSPLNSFHKHYNLCEVQAPCVSLPSLWNPHETLMYFNSMVLSSFYRVWRRSAPSLACEREWERVPCVKEMCQRVPCASPNYEKERVERGEKREIGVNLQGGEPLAQG